MSVEKALSSNRKWLPVLARNIATGQGASFEGLGPTNGFHPLWALCLTPLFVGDPESLFRPIRAMIVLAVFVWWLMAMLALGPVFFNEFNYESNVTNCWLEAAEVVAGAADPGERVASFNSGTFGFLSPRQVVNLDCVVNNRALPFSADKRLDEFVTENRIRFIVDDPAYVRRHFRAYSEKGWDAYLTVVDTLPRGLVLFEVN